MPHKIKGNIGEAGRVLIFDESDFDTIEVNEVVSESGAFDIEVPSSGVKMVLARSAAGEVIGYGMTSSIYEAPAFVEYTQTFGLTSYAYYYTSFYYGSTFKERDWDIYLGRYGVTRYNAFFWVPSVGVPKDATIVSAYFKARSNVGAGNTLSLTAHMADSDSSGTPTSIASYNSAPKTTGTNIYPTMAPTGTYMSFPDVGAEVQQVVNRAGWASGNHMGIFLMQNLTADYDAGARVAGARGANDYGYPYPRMEITWREYA